MNAMVLDDNKYIVEYVKNSVDWKSLGIDEIFGVYDVESAKEKILGPGVDVLILDIELTGETGFELLEWASKQDIELFTTMMTSFAEFDYAQKAIGYHCMDYLLKPVEPEKLQTTVAKLVAEAKAHHMEQENRKKAEGATESSEVLKMIFWENILDDDLSFYGMTLEETMREWHIDYSEGDVFTPILMRLKGGRGKDVSQSLFNFILDNAFREVAAGEGVALETILLAGADRYFVICKGAYDTADLERFIGKLEQSCGSILTAPGEFYVGEAGDLKGISALCNKLEAQYAVLKKAKAEEPDSDGDRQETDRLIDEVKAYIGDNLADVTRASLAEKFFLSPEYLSRVWSKKTGISLMDYIKAEKLDRAKFLLKNSGYSISQVSEMVGYPSFAYFSKIFRLSEGMQPSEYRKKYKSQKL